MNFICGEYFCENSKYVFDEGYLNFSGGVYIPKGQSDKLIEHNKFIYYQNNKENRFIFANPNYLKEVLDFVWKSQEKFILITHKLDSAIDLNFTNRQGVGFEEIITQSNIIHWYAQNANMIHEKLSYIPIGVECPRIELHNLIKSTNYKSTNRKNNYLANFNVRIPYCISNERYTLQMILDKKNIKNTFNLLERQVFINNLENSYFCFSPMGAGIDCHRTWLALYCGAVPVLTRNIITEKIAKKFPVYLIDKWENLNLEDLNKERFLKIKENKIEINDLNLHNFIDILNIFNENSNSINSL